MQTIPCKSLNSGFKLPVFSLGTWRFGGTTEKDPSINTEELVASIQRGIELGIRCIDTAEVYAEGYAEEIVGQAIKDYDRNELEIISKVWKTHLSYDDVISACDASLKRLGIQYLDCYLVHKPNPDIPLSDTMRAMRDLLDQGLVKYVGVSNFSTKRLIHAQELLGSPIVLNQVHYNLTFREPEVEGLLRYCQENDTFLMAWRPLQYGDLACDHSPVLKEVCKKYNKTPSQVAINWLTSQKNVLTVATMRSPKHISENIKALDWSMEGSDVERLRSEFPDQQPVSDSVPLI